MAVMVMPQAARKNKKSLGYSQKLTPGLILNILAI